MKALICFHQQQELEDLKISQSQFFLGTMNEPRLTVARRPTALERLIVDRL